MKKAKKRAAFSLSLLLVLSALFGTGCSVRKTEEAACYIYYLNQTATGLERLSYEPAAAETDTQALCLELLDQLFAGTDRVEYQSPFAEGVSLQEMTCENGQLSLYFNEAYAMMDVVQECLCREALVETLTQISEVTSLYIYVAGEPLTDANGNIVGALTTDSFVDNPGEDINDIQEADLTLYFASLDGSSLVSETQHVYYYSSNISQEKLVMERLLDGPVSENAQSALPVDTGLLSVYVLVGVCGVKLDENFLTQNYDIQEEIVIYSIVNSLSQLSSVDTVQITVNGDNNMQYRSEFSLSEFYTANDDLVAEQGASVEVDTSQQTEKEGLLEAIGE